MAYARSHPPPPDALFFPDLTLSFKRVLASLVKPLPALPGGPLQVSSLQH